MTIRLEVLSTEQHFIRIALYYEVPDVLAGAVDADRVPAGSRLDAAELQALKNGELFEFIRKVRTDGAREKDTHHLLEGEWDIRQAEAEREYNRLYRATGLDGQAWNGRDWT